MIRYLSFLLLLVMNSFAYADLSCLMRLPRDRIDSIGKICEELAFNKFCIEKGRREAVLKNIHYSRRDDGSKILGELDIVVINTDAVIQTVGEVKCYGPNNLIKARKKALDQLDKFHENCIKHKCYFWNNGIEIKIKAPLPKEGLYVALISYLGAGEDFVELDETYAEIQEFLNSL